MRSELASTPGSGTQARSRLRTRQAVGCAVALAAFAWACWHGSAVLRADLGTVRARLATQDWALHGKGWTVESWKRTRADLLEGLRVTPNDPLLHGYLAQLYMTQGLVAWKDPVQREAYFAEAADHLEAQLRLRPHEAVAWASLAQARFVLGRPPAEWRQAWQEAQRLGPRELLVQQALETLVLAGWDDATPQMRGWLREQWRSADAAGRAVLREEARRHGRPEVFE